MIRFSALVFLLVASAASGQSSAPLAVPDALTEAVDAYAAAILAGDTETLDGYWSAEGYADRILDGFTLPSYEVRAIHLGARQVELGTQFAVAEARGSFRFLRFALRDGEPRARFRLIGEDGSLKYLDLLFRADADGAYRLVDAYDYVQGQDLTMVARRILETTYEAGTQMRSDAERTARILDLSRAIRVGDWFSVVDLYPQITPREEDRKTLLMLYLQAASFVAPAQYRKALEQFAQEYSDDPDAALVLVDHHFLEGDLEATLAAINTLDASVGGDPFTDQLRANVYVAADRLGDARAAAERLSEALPELEEAVYPLTDIALAQGDFETVAACLTRLEREFGVVFEPLVLKNNPTWAGFTASAAYKRWLTAREG
ncbi:MAG: hypothetical protein AAF845_16230 [Bacteroidota bacterium]